MNNPLKSATSHDLGLMFPRVTLGACFIIAGYYKIVTVGTEAFVSSQLANAEHYMPGWLANAFLHLLPFVELIVGLLLVLGIYTRLAGFFASLLLISFIIAETKLKISNGALDKNVVFLGAALLALLAGGGSINIRALWNKGKSSKPA